MHPVCQRRALRTALASAATLVCGAFLLLPLACGDEGTLLPELPPGGSPRLTGHVLTCGTPEPARITATDLAHPSGTAAFECRTDSQGRYAMLLAPGRYRLCATIEDGVFSGSTFYYAAGGPAMSSSDADTLIVRDGSTESRADFLFGSIRLRLHLPSTGLIGVLRLAIAPWSKVVSGSTDGDRETEFLFLRRMTLVGVTIAPVPPGTWAVRVETDDLGERLWLPGTWNPTGADSFTVSPDRAVEREFFLNAPVARLRGSVIGSWQAMGLNAPRVSAFVNESTRVSQAVAEDDGSWKMPLYSAHRVRLQVAIENSVRWIGGASWAGAREFTLTPGEEMVLPPEVESGLFIRLRGVVGWPSRDLVLALVDDAGQEAAPVSFNAVADVVPLSNLVPGTYRVHLGPARPGHEAWLPQWFDGASDLGSATSVVLPGGGAVVPITVTLEPGGEIRGRLLGNQSEESWANRSIFVTPADADSVWGCATPSGGGRAFVIRGLPAGSYKICVVRPEFHGPYCGDRFTPSENSDLAWYGGASWDSAGEVTIRDHGPVEGIEIEMNR